MFRGVAADNKGKKEPENPPADFTNIFPGSIELKQPRVLAAGVDKDMSFRIRGNANAFAKVEIRWKLQEVRRRFERDYRHILRLGSRRHLSGGEILRLRDPERSG